MRKSTNHRHGRQKERTGGPMHQQAAPLPPVSFVCPLSLKVMENPVMTSCAHTFEHRALADWVEQQACCPISRKPLVMADLVPNHALADRIEQWKWQHQQENNNCGSSGGGGVSTSATVSKTTTTTTTTTGGYTKQQSPAAASSQHDETTASYSSCSAVTIIMEMDGIERVGVLDGDIELGGGTAAASIKGTSTKQFSSSSFRNNNNHHKTEYRPLEQQQHSLDLLLPQERRALELLDRQARQERARAVQQQCRRSAALYLVIVVSLVVAGALTLAMVWWVKQRSAPW
jgi:U-box domain